MAAMYSPGYLPPSYFAASMVSGGAASGGVKGSSSGSSAGGASGGDGFDGNGGTKNEKPNGLHKLIQKLSFKGAPGPQLTRREAKEEFARTAVQEQVGVYSLGGMVEGVGKFLQRASMSPEKRDAYIEEHPIASVIFKPIHKGAEWLAGVVNPEGSEESVLTNSLKQFGDLGASIGNWLKVGTQIWAARKYNKLSKQSNDAEIVSSAAKANSWRTRIYLIEKVALAGAAGLAGIECFELALPVMALSQGLVMVAAGVSIKGNWPVIKQYKDSFKSLANARDMSKITGLYLAKAFWALATLAAYGYVNLPKGIQERTDLLSKFGFDLVPPENREQMYDLLMQSSWELPSYIIFTGGIFMVAPAAFSLAIHGTKMVQEANRVHKIRVAARKHIKKVENGEDPLVETQEFPIAKSEKNPGLGFYVFGALADSCNIYGGWCTASLFWQPLGAIFNGVGSLFSAWQNRILGKLKAEV
ncbi:MAG: hypothetical protein ABII18_12210 [bacterium]|nr:hypothetical protein [bacterium]MBU1918229.1 hypothetical protein [bacterium]